MPWRQSDPGVGWVTGNPLPISKVDPPDYAGMDIMGSALRQANSAVSIIQGINSSFYNAEPGYSPTRDPTIQGTRMIDDYGDRFVNSRSSAQTQAIVNQIKQEESDKQVLQDSGKTGWVATMIAGLADPTMLLPGGVGLEAAKGGATFGKAALKLGYASAAQMTAQEAAFQATQYTRPLSESAINVASGTLLGAFLGGGAVKVASAAELTAIERGLDRERALMNHENGNPPLPGHPVFTKSTEPRELITPNWEHNDDEYVAKHVSAGNSTMNVRYGPGLEPKLLGKENGIEYWKDYTGKNITAATASRKVGDGVELSPIIGVAKTETKGEDRVLGHVVVSPEFRRQGIGSRMLKYLEQENPDVKMDQTTGLVSPEGASLVNHYNRPDVAQEPSAAPLTEATELPPMPAAVGAAAADVRKLELVPIFGQRITENAKALTSLVEGVPVVGGLTARAMRAVPNLLYRMDPMARIFGARSLTARRAAADAFETALRFMDNLVGIPTVLGGGGALSRLARSNISILQAKVDRFLGDQWKEMKFGNVEKAPYFAKEREAFTDQSAVPQEQENFESFKKDVAYAMRRDDQHSIPQVQKAAQFIRKEIFDPWLKRAQETTPPLIPKDVDVRTAQSYVQRIWDKQAIKAGRPEVANVFQSWLKGEQADKRAAQGRLETYNDNLKALNSRGRQIDDAIARNEETQKTLNAALTERGREVARTEKRAGALEERGSMYQEEIAELDAMIRENRDILSAPENRAHLENMERDLADLRRQDRPMTEAQLRTLEDEEVKGALTGPYRAAAEMLVGRRKMQKVPSFLSWLVANGGIKDEGGELAGVIGGNRVRPGLINSQGRTFHEMGEKLQGEFPGAFPTREETGHGMPERDDILNWISQSGRGHEPAWWVEHLPGADKDALESSHIAATLGELFDRAGVEVKSVKDVGKILRDEFSQSVNLRDLDKIAADMEASGQSVPVAVRRQGKEDEVAIAREDVAKVRQLIASAQAGRAARLKQLGATDIRAGEAQLAERANRGRLGILQDRLDRHETRRELLDDAKGMIDRQHDELRDRLEEEALKWEGDTSVEAKMALRARGKGEEATDRGERMPEARRLTTADDAVNRFVKKALAKDTDLSDSELRDNAHEIIDRILGSPDGRLNYDIDSGGPSVGYSGDNVEGRRGPELARTFGIPDAQVEPWLENDIQHIVNAHLRTMVPDTLLAERFGDPLMTNEFRKIHEEYARMIDAEPDKDKRLELGKEQDQVVRDLAGQRDIFRGVYGYPMYSQMPQLATAARVVKNLNVPASLGMSVISSLPDLGNVMSRFGALTVMKDAYQPLISSLARGDFTLTKEVVRQFRAMGIIIEMEQASRAHSLADTMTSMHPKSPLERGSAYLADKFQLVNLQAQWTDFAKAINGVVAMTELHNMSKNLVAGTHTGRELAILAENGIDRNLAERIAEQYETHGNIVDDVHLSNTGEWTDKQAKSAFESAIQREADIGVVTPGFEKPLMMSNPVFSVLTQFKSFTAGANTRILLANLQRADAQTMSGVTGMLGLGMLSYFVGSLLAGNKLSDNPADWVKEAMARSNVLGWLEEGNQMTAKATRGQLDLYRAIGTDKPLSRYAGRSAVDQLLGPTVGKLEGITQVTGAAASRDWNESDTHALRRVTAFQNVFYLRQMFDAIERGANGAFGIPMKQRD
jgi:GNAT superfamily N-acetyltransferase